MPKVASPNEFSDTASDQNQAPNALAWTSGAGIDRTPELISQPNGDEPKLDDVDAATPSNDGSSSAPSLFKIDQTSQDTVKRPAPAPTVNVWNVRTEQLRSAIVQTQSSGQDQSTSHAEPNTDQVNGKSSSSFGSLKTTPNDGVHASSSSKGSESWPAPHQEPAAPDANKMTGERRVSNGSGSGRRSKNDKTKWIPIPTNITVKSSSAAKRAGSSTKLDNERKAFNTSAGKTRKSQTQASPPGSTSRSTSNSSSKQPCARLKEEGQLDQATSTSNTASSAETTIADDSPQKELLPPTDSHALKPSTKAAAISNVAVAAAATTSQESTPVVHNVDSSKKRNAHANESPSLANASQINIGSSTRGSIRGAFRGGRVSGPRGGFNNNQSQAGSRGMTASGQHILRHQQTAPRMSHQSRTVDGYEAGSPALDSNVVVHSAAPFAPIFDPRTLDPTRYWLLGQLEWWFSVDNLCRDMYLRSQMDAEGWIDISVIASFNRIRNLTTDAAVVRETMALTPLLEVVDEFVRLRQHWPEWVILGAQPSRVSEDRIVAARSQDMYHIMMQQQQQMYQAAMQLGAPMPPNQTQQAPSMANARSRKQAATPSERGASSEDEDEGAGTAATTISAGSNSGEEDDCGAKQTSDA
ncbi:hypothetical protein OIO90_003286 [Microbotryomycetes sp. JL221]|nr:hypothetical protein OIO90_003286 [Microbotryomycetes sp. JL221]